MTTKSRREEITSWLALREREGLTYAELSERCGLAATTLSWWSWRLRRESRGSVRFAEVEVVENDAGSRRSASSADVVVRRGSWSVEVPRGADLDVVRLALAAIADLPC